MIQEDGLTSPGSVRNRWLQIAVLAGAPACATSPPAFAPPISTKDEAPVRAAAERFLRVLTGPKRKYNALGILEDVVEDAPVAAGSSGGRSGTDAVLDVPPAEQPKQGTTVKRDPLIVGAGATRSLNQTACGADWSNVGRNDPCPCGSGKRFKKCHGVAA